MVFSTPYSWDLKFGGTSIDLPFGNIKFKHRIGGFGESGISAGQLEFDIYDTYGHYSEALLEGVPVRIEEKNSRCSPSRNYYISKRTISKHICHFTAYDIMSNVEKDFDPSPLSVFFDIDGTVMCTNVLDEIKNQCGFTSIGASAPGLETIRYTKEMLSERKIRSILEEIAVSMCGVWIADENNGAVLSCLGSPYEDICTPENYSEIDYQGKQQITKLICKNSDSGNVREYNFNYQYGTVIEIGSPFAVNDPGLDYTVWSRIGGYIYQGWNVEKAILTGFIPASCRVYFGEEQLLANNVEISVDSCGIFASLSCDPQSDEMWKYDDYTQRQINDRVAFNKTAGNVQIGNEKGIVFVNKNKTASIALDNNSEIEKYGFNVDAGGITEYDGAMVSSKMFDYAETPDDNTVIIHYEKEKIAYKYTFEEKDGKIRYKKEKITDGSI